MASFSLRATVGILSIGDMGVGIARLLNANNYKCITNASDRRLDLANRKSLLRADDFAVRRRRIELVRAASIS